MGNEVVDIRVGRSMIPTVYSLADLLCLVLGLVLAQWIVGYPFEKPLLVSVAGIVAFRVGGGATGLYRRCRGANLASQIVNSLGTWLISMSGLLLVGTLVGVKAGLNRAEFVIWASVVSGLLLASRLLLHTLICGLRAPGWKSHGFAIVGVTDIGIQLAKNIDALAHLGLKLMGFYDDRPADRTAELPDGFPDKLGNLDDLIEKARRGEVNTIFITFRMRAEDRIRGVLDRLSDSTASVYIVPDFFVYELLHARWDNFRGLPVVSVFETPLYGVDSIVKRLVDLTIGLNCLLFAGLPMMLIAAAIKLTSPGPVFFRQRRYGLDGKEIRVWKFRTMRVCDDGEKVVQAKKNDSRITPLGAILRRTSLDELPQLFNVLFGEMSLVGPRPHATAHNEQYRQLIDGYMLRHKVKPGITGLAQVNGFRGETDTLDKMERRVQCDHQYIREWNVWLDLKILLRTFSIVFSTKNAY
jgi:putative colanic acid biosynthesis UDP-glucose lipid carrier transferase